MTRLLVRFTKNAKLAGPGIQYAVATLMLPIEQTCSDVCPLKADGTCYAQGGFVGIHVRRLQHEYKGKSGEDVARAAGRELRDAATRGEANMPLRLFTAGDASTTPAAVEIASAARSWVARGQAVWGYTHAWRTVHARVWKGIAMLASVETNLQAMAAWKRGYTPAKIVDAHPADGRAYEEGKFTWIPCPEQTRGVPCAKCKLCWDTKRLHDNRMGIAFAIHGERATKLRRRLPLLQHG